MIEDLPDLTPKQQMFVKGLLEGKTASDAYRAAYNCAAMSDAALWVEASKLKSDPKVALWQDAAKQQALVERSYGLQEHLSNLEEAIKLCRDNGNYGAMVKATELLGRASGVYVERIQTDASPLDVAKILLEMGQPGRDLAVLMGIDLPESELDVHPNTTTH